MAHARFIEGGRRQEYYEIDDPNLIKIVGLDKEAPQKRYPQWYDPTCLAGPDDRLVESFLRRGMRKPVEAWKDEESGVLICTDGRCRLVAMREAHKRAKAKGLDFAPRVKVVRWDGGVDARKDPVAQALDVIDANIHVDRSPLQIAEACKRLADLGASEDRIAAAFGWKSKQTVGNYLKLLEVPRPIAAAVEAGEISGAVAREFVGLNASDAKAKLEDLKASGLRLKGPEAVQRARKATGKPEAKTAKSTRLRPRSAIEAIVERWEKDDTAFEDVTAPDFGRWVLGGANAILDDAILG